MSHKRQVWETFSRLAHSLLDTPEMTARTDLEGADREIKRLSKTQFKANALQEAALDQLRQAMDQLSSRDREARRQIQTQARHDLLAALLPVLDGLEAALDSGARLLAYPPADPKDHWVSRRLEQDIDEQAEQLMRQSDRALMAAWLDGLRLVHERVLALLAEAGVEPIPALGQTFDPHRHQAVGTTVDGAHPPGTVVAEQRRGYTGPSGVLRYAEVIVSRRVGGAEPQHGVSSAASPSSSSADTNRKSTNSEE